MLICPPPTYRLGIIPTMEMIRQPAVSQAVIEMMAKMHRLKNGGQACLWNRLRRFLDVSPDGFPDSEVKESKYRRWKIMSKAELAQEINHMEAELKDCDSPIVFCHNDLLLGNIVYDEALGKVHEE